MGVVRVLTLVAIAACGGSAVVEPAGTGAVGAQPCDQNPVGSCYPTDHIGFASIVLDDQGEPVTRGDRLANARFVGFRAHDASAPIDPTQPPETIALSDFYDPSQVLAPGGGGISVLRIMVNTAWCGPSNEEADFVSGGDYTGQNTGGASFARELEPLGVVFLEVLSDGPVDGEAATLANLQTWTTNHAVDYTAVIDDTTGASLFASAFPRAAIPFSIDVDARSMEILAIDVGFDTVGDTKLEGWVAWEKTHAPL